MGKSMYADDGALWKRGRNITYTVKKVQQAVNKVEEWARLGVRGGHACAPAPD